MELISREAAIEAIEELVSTMSVCVSMEECKGMNWMKQRAIAAIREQPTIDPVKHGRWSRERLPSLSGGTYEVWRCSECQSAFNWRMRFCGDCGARMEGEENV